MRFKSPENLSYCRSIKCASCNQPPPSDPAHIRSRGAGGGDELHNLVSLCRLCHIEQHQYGWFIFTSKHPNIKAHLAVRGWGFNGRKLVKQSS